MHINTPRTHKCLEGKMPIFQLDKEPKDTCRHCVWPAEITHKWLKKNKKKPSNIYDDLLKACQIAKLNLIIKKQ